MSQASLELVLLAVSVGLLQVYRYFHARRARLDPTIWTSVAQVAPTVKRWRHQETLGYVKKIEETYEALKSAR